MISNIHIPKQQRKRPLNNHIDRYKFLFENSPIPIQETNVKQVASELNRLREIGITDIEEYIQNHPKFISNLFKQSDIFDINQAILQLFEAESKDDYLQNFKEVLYNPCLEFFKLVLINVFNGTNTILKEAELSTFKGKKIWVEIKATYLSFSGEEMVNYTLKDITEEKLKDQAINLINERMVKGTPQEHLNNLVLALSEAFDISHVFISSPNKELTFSKTLAFSNFNKLHSSVTYDLQKAPCLEIYEQKTSILHADHLDRLYPNNNFIKVWNGKSYLGFPLFNDKGEVIGDFSFINNKPITNLGVIQDVMGLYAAWASSELQRLEYQKAQEESEHTLNIVTNNIGDVFYAFDLDYNIIAFNQVAKVIFQEVFNTELIIGEKLVKRKLADLPRDLINDFKYIKKAFQGNVVNHYKAYKINDATKYYSTTFSPIIDNDGQVKGCVAIAKDLTELKNVEATLQQKNKTIEQQLLSLEQKNEELEKYIESNSQLENFAYIASHDLKAPIRTIVSFSQLLQRNLKNTIDDNSKEYLDFVISASKNMKQLIEDLLEYSRIDSVKLNPEIVNINDLLFMIQYELKSTIEEKKPIIILNNIPEAIAADYTKLKQVFQNLITNAIKFHKKDEFPKIEISCKDENEFWKFTVKDSGIGIKPAYFERIFVLFQKLHTNKEYEGTGLGLAICKKIIEQHQGQIWIESEVNVGTTFHFTISKNI
jgi:signal transduction histidine kinase